MEMDMEVGWRMRWWEANGVEGRKWGFGIADEEKEKGGSEK